MSTLTSFYHIRDRVEQSWWGLQENKQRPTSQVINGKIRTPLVSSEWSSLCLADLKRWFAKPRELYCRKWLQITPLAPIQPTKPRVLHQCWLSFRDFPAIRGITFAWYNVFQGIFPQLSDIVPDWKSFKGHESDIFQGRTATLPDGPVCFCALVDKDVTILVLVKCPCLLVAMFFLFESVLLRKSCSGGYCQFPLRSYMSTSQGCMRSYRVWLACPFLIGYVQLQASLAPHWRGNYQAFNTQNRSPCDVATALLSVCTRKLCTLYNHQSVSTLSCSICSRAFACNGFALSRPSSFFS